MKEVGGVSRPLQIHLWPAGVHPWHAAKTEPPQLRCPENGATLAGVLTSDPRIVEAAAPVPLLTYEEATELAFFGATVLHPLAMQPALQSRSLAVRVKNSYNRCAPAQGAVFLPHEPAVNAALPAESCL